MKRRRRSRSVLAVSLFPFLAVLICTLGVLIVLLVLAVKAADSQAAVAQADANSTLNSRLNELQLELEERQIQIDGLKDVRPEALQRLEEARATRSHFENELRQLQREARLLAESLLRLENQRHGVQADLVSDVEITQLERKIAESKVLLARKREQLPKVSDVVYSIQPYRGSNGTHRRPIYVEALSDHLMIQPLDIKITQTELRKAVFPGNMLDAALLAIREYWQKYDLEGEAGRAYPLIVVRPDGAKTFELTRKSLKAWDDEYGYEIVDADKKIDFGQYDAELADEVKVAVEEARNRQNRLAEVAIQRQRLKRKRDLARRPRSEQRPGLTVSRTGGGFVFNGVKSVDGLDRDGQYVSTHGSSRSTGAASKKNSGSNDLSAAFAGREAGRTLSSASNAGGGGQQNSGQAADGSSAQANQPDQADSNQPPAAANSSLAKTRGANWALPSRSAGAVPYVRPLRIVCFEDRLIVKGARGDAVVPMNGATEKVVDELVNEVWTQIDSWGVAGQNSYWKPQLRISVMPGSHFRFRELRRLMADSGILVEGAE
jgi:hypothetical protein